MLIVFQSLPFVVFVRIMSLCSFSFCLYSSVSVCPVFKYMVVFKVLLLGVVGVVLLLMLVPVCSVSLCCER